MIMEYRQTYIIGKKMHLVPCGELVRIIKEIKEENPEIEVIRLENEILRSNGSQNIDPTNVFGLMAAGTTHLAEGRDIDIYIRGDYPQDILRKCVDRIGKYICSENVLEE